MTTIIITFIICALGGFSFGKMSNGMTSPRQAFNFFTGPFMAVAGAVIGGIGAGVAGGAVGTGILTGLVVGLIAGLIGLGVARLIRRMS